MLYKFGYHKLLLRSGKLVGLTGGLLILAQLVSVSHLAFPEWLFTRSGLLRFHRINGLCLALLLVHPVLILGADDFAFYPLEKKYLPEFVGMALLFFLLLLVVTARFRARLPISYRAWRSGHRLGALVVVGLFFVHLLKVSETFRTGLPYNLALGLAGVEGFILLLIFGRALLGAKKRRSVV